MKKQCKMLKLKLLKHSATSYNKCKSKLNRQLKRKLI